MEQLFEKMQNLVDGFVEHYQEDFEADKKFVLEVADKNNDTIYERYLFWILRKCGTNIGYKSNVPISATYSYFLRQNENGEKENKFYELDLENQTIVQIENPKEYFEICRSNN